MQYFPSDYKGEGSASKTLSSDISRSFLIENKQQPSTFSDTSDTKAPFRCLQPRSSHQQQVLLFSVGVSSLAFLNAFSHCTKWNGVPSFQSQEFLW